MRKESLRSDADLRRHEVMVDEGNRDPAWMTTEGRRVERDIPPAPAMREASKQ